MEVEEFLDRANAALTIGGEKARRMRLTKVWGCFGLILDEEGQELVIMGRFLNPEADQGTATSLYSAIALSKMAESALSPDGANTPAFDREKHHGATGYRGGGRRGEIVFGVSGAKGEEDFAVGAAMSSAFRFQKVAGYD